jgi:hypothetical protein
MPPRRGQEAHAAEDNARRSDRLDQTKQGIRRIHGVKKPAANKNVPLAFALAGFTTDSIWTKHPARFMLQ